MKKSLFLVFCLIITGCAVHKALFLSPDYLQRQPRTISVLPMEDARLIKEGKPKLEKKIIKALKRRGYKVLDMEQTMQILQKSNIIGDSLYSTNPKRLCKELGVDAVLKSCLYEYFLYSQLIAHFCKLKIEFSLIDGKDGFVLWKERLDKDESGFGSTSIDLWILPSFKSLPKLKR